MASAAVAVIPARYASTRFPGKPLVPILGRPLVLHVADAVARALGPESVYVATDDERIRAAVGAAGFRALMTAPECLTGTDRVAEAARQLAADVVLNVQGDEPLVAPADIRRVLEEKQRHPDQVVNGMCRLRDDEDPADPNLIKVVTAPDGRLLYMSRAAIPFARRAVDARGGMHKQVCIYAFTPAELARFSATGRKTPIEQLEDIEIMRCLELGMPVRMLELAGGSIAVDAPADVERVAAALAEVRT